MGRGGEVSKGIGLGAVLHAYLFAVLLFQALTQRLHARTNARPAAGPFGPVVCVHGDSCAAPDSPAEACQSISPVFQLCGNSNRTSHGTIRFLSPPLLKTSRVMLVQAEDVATDGELYAGEIVGWTGRIGSAILRFAALSEPAMTLFQVWLPPTLDPPVCAQTQPAEHSRKEMRSGECMAWQRSAYLARSFLQHPAFM